MLDHYNTGAEGNQAESIFLVLDFLICYNGDKFGGWKRGIIMETKYYVVARIDGDYAWQKRTDAEEEPLFIARALLPYAPARLLWRPSTRGRT